MEQAFLSQEAAQLLLVLFAFAVVVGVVEVGRALWRRDGILHALGDGVIAWIVTMAVVLNIWLVGVSIYALWLVAF